MAGAWKRYQVATLIESGALVVGDGYRAKNSELTSSGLPFARVSNINAGFFFKDADYFPEENLRLVGNKVSQPGDVVFTSKGTVGRFGFVSSDTPRFVYSPQLCFWRSVDRQLIDPRFLSFWMSGREFFIQFRGVASQTDMADYVSLTDQRRMHITLPPLPEQRRIVALLDQTFAAIATAKANAEKNLQNARALFESHLQSVFTRRGSGWVEKTVDTLSTNLDSKRIPITKSNRKAGSYPYYGASGIVDYVADYIFEGDALLVSEDGANLLMRSTPIAFSVSGKYWVNNHAHILKFENMATQRFVEFYLESLKLDEYIRGAAQPKLTQKALNSIPIPIPTTFEEQARIVENLDSLYKETQRFSSIYERKLAALDELKKSLLHQAFTGEL